MSNLQFQHFSVPAPLEESLMQGKKRKMCDGSLSIHSLDNNRENLCCVDNRVCAHPHTHPHTHPHAQNQFAGRHFLHLRHSGETTVYHTEDWQPSGSTLFFPLSEDLMVNTRNIEQFSCSSGNFFVAGEKGVYSKTLSGDVLHLWRFCPQKKKLFISRSFLFTNSQHFYEVQQTLQRL